MTVASTSIVEKLSVSRRATTAGTTSVAAISVTPITFIVARMVAASTIISMTSTSDGGHTRCPGDLGVEGREQQRPVADQDEHERGERDAATSQTSLARPRGCCRTAGRRLCACAEQPEQRQPEREARSRDDADRRIAADDPTFGDPTDRERRGQAPDPGAEEEVEADQAGRGSRRRWRATTRARCSSCRGGRRTSRSARRALR